MQLQAYEKIIGQLAAENTALVAISPMLPQHNLTMQQKLALSFPILSDPGNSYAQELNMAFQLDSGMQSAYLSKGLDLPTYNGDTSWQLPITAVFILDKNHSLVYAWSETDYKLRPEPEGILQELKADEQ